MNEGDIDDIDDQQVESVSVSKINACSSILEVSELNRTPLTTLLRVI